MKQKLPQHLIERDKRHAEIGMKYYRLRCPDNTKDGKRKPKE